MNIFEKRKIIFEKKEYDHIKKAEQHERQSRQTDVDRHSASGSVPKERLERNAEVGNAHDRAAAAHRKAHETKHPDHVKAAKKASDDAYRLHSREHRDNNAHDPTHVQ